ncbi:beta-lactamase family protein [Rhizobiaceae bacterium BDR2-2]|uniref:Beta-lactamase family protein n=1 Tax=Ectorhizobium quercum TaxID=2965071 RepID=A0AAE3MXI0_9HYPH|nr:serine hydrolase [Ectorhizobium quercum]MCX8995894.1 beta-lactamase family protein [Ectorhizobium quercum]
MMDTLPRAEPQDRLTDPAVLLAMLDEIERQDIELHSLLIWQEDALVTEAYWAPFAADRPHMMHSVTKSFTSVAVGLAVGEGLMSVDDTVMSFFPEHAGINPAPNLQAMRVRHLLTMTSGHDRGISGGAWRRLKTSWIADFLRQPVPYEPGTVFVYDSAASYMLSAIVQRVTGRPVHDYLDEKIFRPMSMSPSMTWDVGPDGVNTGGNGMSCTALDMLKLGILHLQGGAWQGRQLLPRQWVADATALQVRDVVLGVFTGDHYLGPGEEGDGSPAARREGYGYQWWRGPHNSFSANGLFGQYCIVLPEQKAVVAFTGGLADSDRRVHSLIYDHLRPALGAGVSASGRAGASLPARLAGLSLKTQPGVVRNACAGNDAYGVYRIAENDQHVSRIAILPISGGVEILLEDADGQHRIHAGFGRWIEAMTTMPGARLHHSYQPEGGLRILACARWLPLVEESHVLEMDWVFVETAFRDTVRLYFHEGDLRMTRKVNVNSMETHLPDLTGRFVAQVPAMGDRDYA